MKKQNKNGESISSLGCILIKKDFYSLASRHCPTPPKKSKIILLDYFSHLL